MGELAEPNVIVLDSSYFFQIETWFTFYCAARKIDAESPPGIPSALIARTENQPPDIDGCKVSGATVLKGFRWIRVEGVAGR